MRRALTALICSLAVVPAFATGSPVSAQPRRTASAGILELVGHGYGHGIGLSQWGAYGYAVDHGWSAEQILAHYYGGTVAGTIDPGNITVRLMNLDDKQTAVVHDHAQLAVDGVGGGPWPSVVAREVAPNSYSVWARADARVCPGAADDLAGWTLVASGLVSVTIRTATDTSASADYADLLAVCEPSGQVRSYRGSIRAVNGNAGENRTVNDVPIEQYLRPIVASEMSASWASAGGGRGMQALQAQAVAARSYGTAEKKYSYAKTCDLTCQYYRGAAWRSSVSGSYNRVEQAATDMAVAATANVVRRVGSTSGPVAYAMFAASSGGWTAASTLGFPAVPDLGDATPANPNHTWTASVTYGVLSQAWPAIGTFTGITITKRSGEGDLGGRVLNMTVDGTNGSVAITGDQFRRAVGLKSNWFAVTDGSSEAPSPSPTPAPAAGGGVDPCVGQKAPPAAAGSESAPAARLQAMTPVRLVDTREGFGAALAPLGRGCTLVVDPAVADGATAVAINITSVNTVDNGFITAYPCDAGRTLAATVQPIVGLVVGGAALVPLAADGTFCLFTNVPTDVVVDLFGVFAPDAAGRFEPVVPQRRYDSRPSGSRVPGGSIVRVDMRANGAPVDATAVALTVHALDPVAGAYVTVWPCDAAQPFVSGANVAAGGSITNHVEVALGASGEVCLFSNASTHLAVDMSGWYGPSATTDFYATTPFRLADTREGQGWSGMFSRNVDRSISVTSVGALPDASRVRAVAGQFTAVDATAGGYVTVHPCQSPVPDLSMLRHPAQLNVAVLVTGITDGTGRWCVTTSSATHIVIDITGWFG